MPLLSPPVIVPDGAFKMDRELLRAFQSADHPETIDMTVVRESGDGFDGYVLPWRTDYPSTWEAEERAHAYILGWMYGRLSVS